ncbi:hypothetical protein QR680_004907 [Steinernema hermaphroditum]|uniref:Uncharacterized protein n=1 Tax=Steinernema hermaphroditum TaxID=289476 RepID=A0AA39HRN2_9BILA|nr:hypothetical protein QR680_004907 [Steinernema hermaphroditum]
MGHHHGHHHHCDDDYDYHHRSHCDPCGPRTTYVQQYPNYPAYSTPHGPSHPMANYHATYYPPPGGYSHAGYPTGGPPPPHPGASYPPGGYPGAPPPSGEYSKPGPPPPGGAYGQQEFSKPTSSSQPSRPEPSKYPSPNMPPSGYGGPYPPPQSNISARPAEPLPYPTNQSVLFPKPGPTPHGPPKAPYPNQYPSSDKSPPPPYAE